MAEKDFVDKQGWTVLMWVCRWNPQLLATKQWFVLYLWQQVGSLSAQNDCALSLLFETKWVERADFEQPWFSTLFEAEREILGSNEEVLRTWIRKHPKVHHQQWAI